MYRVMIWDEDKMSYVPERDEITNKPVEFEHWQEAADEATVRRLNDSIMRKVEYNRGRRTKRA